MMTPMVPVLLASATGSVGTMRTLPRPLRTEVPIRPTERAARDSSSRQAADSARSTAGR